MSAEISGPLAALTARLLFHQQTGYNTPLGIAPNAPGTTGQIKIIGDFPSVIQQPETRGQYTGDLPLIAIYLRPGALAVTPKSAFGIYEVLLDVAVARDEGLIANLPTYPGPGLAKRLEQVIDAIMLDERGYYDPYICHSLAAPLKLVIRDIIAYQNSYAASVLLTLQTHVFQSLTQT